MPHRVAYWKCNNCKELFEPDWIGKGLAERHEATHHGVTKLDHVCKCTRGFNSRRGLLQHIDYPGRTR